MDTSADHGPELGARLTYLLKRALLRLEELHVAHLAPTGVNVRELTILMFLAGREPESQQQAAAKLGVDRTTMVGLLDSLEAKKLVARQPDAEDRRRNVVVLTAPGRRTLAKAKAASDLAEQQLLAQLPPRDATRLRELLSRVGDTEPLS